jgi:hypothetical protein
MMRNNVERHGEPLAGRRARRLGDDDSRRQLGIGRTHARTHVLLLVQHLDIRVVNAAAGQLVRELTLDPPTTTSPPAGPRDRAGTL